MARIAHALASLPLLGSAALASDTPAWEDVREVIATRCLSCHGGDARKGGFSFANAATFAEGGDRGAVFAPENPEASPLLLAIRYADPDFSMPPSGALAEDERSLLEGWVLAGAPWPAGEAGQLADPELFARTSIDLEAGADWWAYRPLVPPPVPKNGREHPIDAFLAQRLFEAALTPAPRAEPETLLRRATFDLTGLPPSPPERRAFLTDVERQGFDAAWEALLDRLLESPQHAEAWARHWLDLVRYAETNGYERDGTKVNMWRYRDWVVRALEQDLPYDDFLVQQLAGDELAQLERDGAVPTHAADAALATGYYRLGIWDDEPADPLQARWDELADIVDTTGQVFLGTTLGCARCHDHKADPIRQSDYYAFTAFFNHLDGYGGGSFGQHLGGGQLRDVPDAPGSGVLTVESRNEQLAFLEQELLAEAERARLLNPADEAAPAPLRPLVADARDTAAEPWSYLVQTPEDERPAGWTTPAFDDGEWPTGRGGFGVAGTPVAIVGTEWASARILLRTTFLLGEIPEALALTIHHDEDAEVFLNGARVAALAGYRSDYASVQLGPDALAAAVVGRNVLAVECRQTLGGQSIDVGLSAGFLPDADWPVRLELALARGDAPGLAAVRALWAEREGILELPVAEPYPAQVIAERAGVPEPQAVLGRGSAHAPGERVEPHLPEVFRAAAGSVTPSLPTPDADAPSSGRRLALARWLVDEGAFLTARVQANRMWQFHFGRGLCRSVGDFGRLGTQPTHPELLDHLASELVRRGWSQREMHRYLMTSDAYQRTSVGSEQELAEDPHNDLYWRFDPRRMRAEEYRDAVLAVAGRLNLDSGGPSVYPPMDPAVLATASRPDRAWGRSTPEQADRRSLYAFVKRSLRLPLLENLDQPDPDLPCPERFPTNVPTQALISLNGAFTREAAASFARRLEGESPDREGRIRRGLLVALGRLPLRGEVKRQMRFFEALLSADGLEESEALETWCLALFNRNEFLWID